VATLRFVYQTTQLTSAAGIIDHQERRCIGKAPRSHVVRDRRRDLPKKNRRRGARMIHAAGKDLTLEIALLFVHGAS
jgi:hypothetical protein